VVTVGTMPPKKIIIQEEPGDTTITDLEKSVNAVFMGKFNESLQRLLADPAFEDSQEQPALVPAQGGAGAGFSQEGFKSALRSAESVGSYQFIGNVFIHDVSWRPLPSIPINTKGVEDMITHLYNDGKTAPQHLTFEVVVAVDREWNDLKPRFGKLKRLSPEEPVFALLMAAERAKTVECKQQYARLLRSVRSVCQHFTEPSAMVRASINIREELRTAPNVTSMWRCRRVRRHGAGEGRGDTGWALGGSGGGRMGRCCDFAWWRRR
jgi:hypothetical protein